MTMLGSNLARAIMAPEQKKMAVWIKGHTIPGLDPAVWRRDDDGNTIRYPDYGDRDAHFGWEIDRIFSPGAEIISGTDSDGISNLRPLHRTNNATLSPR
jgi:hypothetical protein